MKKKWCMPETTDARSCACSVLLQVEQGGYADILLDKILRHGNMPAVERSLTTELVYGVLRRRAGLDYALKGLCRQGLDQVEMPVRCLLRLGAYQILFLDRIPARAAVHTSVELARKMNIERATGFLNGVLRNLVRNAESISWPQLERDPEAYMEHVLSLPAWMARLWIAYYGCDTAVRLAEMNTAPAPNTARVNTLKISRAQIMKRLEDRGVEAQPTLFAPDGIVFQHGGFAHLPEVEEGLIQPQDEASIIVGHLLQVQPGHRVLDVCAAPGGKTCHIAALGDNRVDITALDLHQHRLERVKKGAERLGCRNITTRAWDMTQPCAFLPELGFERVLVDAPCSGLGVLRRNPEMRWRRTPADVAELAALQGQILANAASCVAPQGRMLYSLCTMTREESDETVKDFLLRHPDFEQEDLRSHAPASWQMLFDSKGCLRTLSCDHGGMDCFFATSLRRVR